MSVRLRPLGEDEWPAFVQEGKRHYADDMVENGSFAAEKVAFLYDLHIDEHARGSGLGRAAMLALEEEVCAEGLERISLNVFGGNSVARGLYTSLGYQEMHVWMSKDLSSGRSWPS